MLDSELNSHDTDSNEAKGRTGSGQEPASVSSTPAAPAVPAALFQAPQVLFQPPAPVAVPPAASRDAGGRDSAGRDSAGRDSTGRDSTGRDGTGRDGTGRDSAGRDGAGREAGGRDPGDGPGESGAESDGTPSRTSRRTSRGTRGARGTRATRGGDGGQAPPDDDLFSASRDAADTDRDSDAAGPVGGADGAAADEGDGGPTTRRRRRRSTRSRTRLGAPDSGDANDQAPEASDDTDDEADEDAEGFGAGSGEGTVAGRRRRRKRRRGSADTDVSSPDDPPDTVVHVREPHNIADDVRAIKGSTRLEAKKQRRREGRESGRRRPPVITESEFLARRESVERTMVVRQRGDRTQIAVLEDDVLVEHYVNRTTHQSYVGNVYLGKVQNVLPSMEAAFVDIGKGRNAVLYAGEVNFDASGLEGQPKRIESALKPGQSVIVQVTKDPVGHKGARLTSQVSLPGRYLVYVPGASMTGISRKLPDTERNRLKHILKKVIPENGGVIVRTAAEGAAEAELDRDVTRLAAQWENIEKKAKTATAPALLYGEPDLTIRVVRDVFNEDFSKLIVSGDEGWDTIDEYVRYVAPHLASRLTRWTADGDDDVFTAYRIDEQLAKALERKVWLPSGGSLVIDRTEAMTVVDVNTGKFTGQGGNLEETVTRNNLEAAEEIVRQLRLRDVGGIVVIDFIDMVLESNRELVLRRLLECLARDRTKHQVAEVTSLGLVQMTRKRVGAGLLEAFSAPCECCNGRGVIITLDQPEPGHRSSAGHSRRPGPGSSNGTGNGLGAGNGAGARPGQDRQWDRPAADSDDSDDRAAQDTPARDEGQRSRRGRRGTNGGTASASVVRVAEAPAATTPVTVVDDVAPVVAPAPAEATTAPAEAATAPATPATPGRRTRAGSAMARLAVTTEDPAPLATVIVPPAPAESAPPTEAPPAPEPAPAEEAAPVQDAPQVEDAAPVDDAVRVQDTAPVEDAPALEDVVPADDVAPAETAAPVTDAAPLEDAAPLKDVVPVEAAIPAEGVTPVESAVPAEDATPVEDTVQVEDAPTADAESPQATPVSEETPPAAAPSAPDAATE